jgi:tetratricopeptide (TPR) repeat protein
LQQQWSAESDSDRLLAEGASLLASRDFERAYQLLERAAGGLPDSELAQFNLGLAAIGLERWEVAERALGRAIELNPSRAESYLNRGIALQYLDLCDEAITVLKRGLELQPDLTQSHYYLYECYRRLGDEKAAAEHRRLYSASVEGDR